MHQPSKHEPIIGALHFDVSLLAKNSRHNEKIGRLSVSTKTTFLTEPCCHTDNPFAVSFPNLTDRICQYEGNENSPELRLFVHKRFFSWIVLPAQFLYRVQIARHNFHREESETSHIQKRQAHQSGCKGLENCLALKRLSDLKSQNFKSCSGKRSAQRYLLHVNGLKGGTAMSSRLDLYIATKSMQKPNHEIDVTLHPTRAPRNVITEENSTSDLQISDASKTTKCFGRKQRCTSSEW